MAESLYDSASMAYAKNPGQLPIRLRHTCESDNGLREGVVAVKTTAAMNVPSPAPPAANPPPEIAGLRRAAAARGGARRVASWGADGHSPQCTLDENKLDAVADYVAEVPREAYPDLDI